MRDLLGLLCLIGGGALATIYFALGILLFILAVVLLNNGHTNIESYLEIMGPLAILSVIVVWLIALFQ